jgi:hypothetical protein
VRDGRSVARSLLSMEWGPDTMAEAATEWRDSVERGRAGAAAFGDRYRELRYEKLLAEPASRMAEVFGWLGLDVNEATRERVLAEAASEFNVDPGSPGVGAAKWRDELSDGDLRTFDRIAGAQLEACGYERPRLRPAAGVPRRAAARTRAVAARIRRPRPAARAAFARALARRDRRELHDSLRVVNLLAGYLELGDDDAALGLLAPRAWVHVTHGDVELTGRGPDAARTLLAAAGEHRAHGLKLLTGELHASPSAFTSVGTYELGDGSRWARTQITHVRRGRVTRLALYAFRVYM